MTARERLLKRRPRRIEMDGEPVYIRSLTLAENIKAESLRADPEKGYELLAFVVATCVVDADGQPVFTGPDDAAIQDLPSDTLTELTMHIGKASKAGSLASVEKNSVATN